MKRCLQRYGHLLPPSEETRTLVAILVVFFSVGQRLLGSEDRVAQTNGECDQRDTQANTCDCKTRERVKNPKKSGKSLLPKKGSEMDMWVTYCKGYFERMCTKPRCLLGFQYRRGRVLRRYMGPRRLPLPRWRYPGVG